VAGRRKAKKNLSNPACPVIFFVENSEANLTGVNPVSKNNIKKNPFHYHKKTHKKDPLQL
jgi:hypothetical protein